MKNVCFTFGSLQDLEMTKSLKLLIRKDLDLNAASILCATHNQPACRIRFRQTEIQGFILDEQAEICIEKPFSTQSLGDTGYVRKMLKLIQPEIVLIYGSSFFSYQAAVAASLADLPVAHLCGKTEGLGTWEKNYGTGIEKIAGLHFTETSAQHQQILKAGKHPDAVFHVGDLNHSKESIKKILKPLTRSDILKKTFFRSGNSPLTSKTDNR